jgi:hypothetical protein
VLANVYVLKKYVVSAGVHCVVAFCGTDENLIGEGVGGSKFYELYVCVMFVAGRKANGRI